MKYWIILMSFYTLINALVKNHGQDLPYLLQTGRQVLNSNLKIVKSDHVLFFDYGKFSKLTISQ